jgi:ATP-dependent DNA helicase RecG
MEEKELQKLITKLLAKPKECEWIEFKHNFHSPEEIGETISALSNGACLHKKPHGFLVFGIEDGTHNILGTTFSPKTKKVKNDELEHWLNQRLNPHIDFIIFEFKVDDKKIVLFQIQAASIQPIDFLHTAYIRIGSIVRKLTDFPEKERKIWLNKAKVQFEKNIALNDISSADVIDLLDTQCYFDLRGIPYPSNREGVIKKFISEKILVDNTNGLAITNLGGLLFAKDLRKFPNLSRKAFRVVVYKGKNKLDTLKDIQGNKGYAVGFEGLVNYINDQLPQNEEITKTLRKKVKMFPEEAIRELVANSLIHQDFSELGPPVVEIYSDRIEFTNAGVPIITPIRFIDEYQSRNELLADLMRRLGFCEEKGSGIDRVVHLSEIYQLPAPEIIVQEIHTKVILFSHLKLNQMDKKDKIRACYQHAALKYVSNEKMTNQSLRERFQIDEKNSAIASRIIKETLETELIKYDDPSSGSRKYAKYIPFWA